MFEKNPNSLFISLAGFPSTHINAVLSSFFFKKFLHSAVVPFLKINGIFGFVFLATILKLSTLLWPLCHSKLPVLIANQD